MEPIYLVMIAVPVVTAVMVGSSLFLSRREAARLRAAHSLSLPPARDEKRAQA